MCTNRLSKGRRIPRPVRLWLFGTLVTSLATPLPASAGWRDWLDKARESTHRYISAEQGGHGLTQDEIVKALQEALEIGVQQAVARLGRNGGFLQDPVVRIELPAPLATVARALRMIGQDRLVDDFVTSMNHAAELAVRESVPIFIEAIEQMRIEDARRILEGPEDAATRYFRRHTESRLYQRLHPIVKTAIRGAQATRYYASLLEKARATVPYADRALRDFDLDDYITRKALDGLFLKIAEEERKIRKDPAARTTELLKEVFGSLTKSR